LNAKFYIAKRYLIAKKSHNAINIVSMVAMFGVMIGSTALIVVLSVFNGFEELITSLFNSFDPDFKISAVEGKTFDKNDSIIQQIKTMDGVVSWSEVIEENALIRYDDKQYIATIKGVDSNFTNVSDVKKMVVEGEYMLHDNYQPYAVVGMGVAYFLSVGLSFVHPLVLYVPKRGEVYSFNPEEAFNRQYIFPSGLFSVEKETDMKYVIVPIKFARELYDYKNEVSFLEVKVKPGTNIEKLQKNLEEIAQDKFTIKNRMQQKDFFYKVMKSEKWAIFVILAFIVVIASFNIIGSLSMLIIEKKNDLFTLHSLGADMPFIEKIFLYEGMLICAIGAIAGLILGGAICWAQQTFGLIQLQGGSSFIISAYPVKMIAHDFLAVFLTVIIIGYIAAALPVRYLTKKHLVI